MIPLVKLSVGCREGVIEAGVQRSQLVARLF